MRNISSFRIVLFCDAKLKDLWNVQKLLSCKGVNFVFVLLLFYGHDKHLRSCRDG